MEKCRACLATEFILYYIDEDFVRNYNIITNLNIKSTDDLSQLVCDTCLQAVKFFIAFREKCLLSETSLLGIGELARHMETHKDAKPYKCAQCPKAYKEFHGLARHTSRRHDGRSVSKDIQAS